MKTIKQNAELKDLRTRIGHFAEGLAVVLNDGKETGAPYYVTIGGTDDKNSFNIGYHNTKTRDSVAPITGKIEFYRDDSEQLQAEICFEGMGKNGVGDPIDIFMTTENTTRDEVQAIVNLAKTELVPPSPRAISEIMNSLPASKKPARNARMAADKTDEVEMTTRFSAYRPRTI